MHGLKRKEKEGKPRTSFCHGMQFLPICGDLLQNCPVLQKQLPLVLVVSSVVIFREAITSKPFTFGWSLQCRRENQGSCTLVQLTLEVHRSRYSVDGILTVLKFVSIIKRSLKGHISHEQRNATQDLHLQKISKFNDLLPLFYQSFFFFFCGGDKNYELI